MKNTNKQLGCFNSGGSFGRCAVLASIAFGLSACGGAVPGGVDGPGSGDLRPTPLNDTGVTYVIDDQNVSFYENIANHDIIQTNVNPDPVNYKFAGSPLMYGVNDPSRFPKIPASAIPQVVLSIDALASAFPGQDARSGVDVDTFNSADGWAGFNFTKLDAVSGLPVDVTAIDYGCVLDNNTGLVWEHKKNTKISDAGTDGWHSKDAYFTWYDPNSATNGGDPGERASQSSCSQDPKLKGDTLDLIGVSNAEQLCGVKNWRLPTIEELRSIVNYEVKSGTTGSPAMTDHNYFPYVSATAHRWTSQTVNLPGYRNKAFAYHLHEGQVQAHFKRCEGGSVSNSNYWNGALLVADYTQQ